MSKFYVVLWIINYNMWYFIHSIVSYISQTFKITFYFP